MYEHRLYNIPFVKIQWQLSEFIDGVVFDGFEIAEMYCLRSVSSARVMMMDIFLAADHKGYSLKSELAAWLRGEGYHIEDLGAKTYNKDDDYPDFAALVAKAVADDPENRYGIVICGSGVGMAVTANKIPGIRAALIHDPRIAVVAREDDGMNVLALGSSFIDLTTAKEVISALLKTRFSEQERHVRRIKKISSYES